MPITIGELAIYLHLARAFWRKKQMSDRDRLLILAGVASNELRLKKISAYCRALILENNHGHMIRRWENFSAALEDSDFLHLFKQICRKFPMEKAESVLDNFGIELANERDTYYSDNEYAAAIIGVRLDWLEKNF